MNFKISETEMVDIIRHTPLPANGGRDRTWYLTKRQSLEIYNSLRKFLEEKINPNGTTP